MVKPAAAWTERSLDLSRLLARAGLGDRAAFATHERTSSHLFAVVLRINRDRAQAEDILQEVYVKVWRAAQSFDAAQSQPLTWLTSIARHRAIDSLRREQTQPRLQTPGAAAGGTDAEDEDVYDTVADAAPGPLDLLSRATDARALGECMDKLSALQRQSVALAFYQGLSHAEVASAASAARHRRVVVRRGCSPSRVPAGRGDPQRRWLKPPCMDYSRPELADRLAAEYARPCAARRGAASRACCRRIRSCARRPAPGKSG
jgi:RNA polymerase sigma-70 factor (ECF subfamily)